VVRKFRKTGWAKMTLMIYNTMTRNKEPFETLEPGEVRMYVCGPTVYDKAHVGHAMSSIVFDVIRRYLEYKGFHVKHVMNYTDVEDKVIKRANELGMDPLELADGYLVEYEQHLQDLNVLPPIVTPRASEEIDSIISMVEGLVEEVTHTRSMATYTSEWSRMRTMEGFLDDVWKTCAQASVWRLTRVRRNRRTLHYGRR